jgi:hypothetical protein
MSEQDHNIVKRFKRTKRVQMTAIAGVCVAIGVILGMLTSFFSGMEKSDGEKSEPAQVSTEPGSTPLIPKEIKPDKKNEVKMDTVHVLVDDEQYFIQTTTDDKPVKTKTSLKEIIDTVKNAAGNKEGVKIQIKILKSARLLTENALKDALSEAEIPSSAIAIVEE